MIGWLDVMQKKTLSLHPPRLVAVVMLRGELDGGWELIGEQIGEKLKENMNLKLDNGL